MTRFLLTHLMILLLLGVDAAAIAQSTSYQQQWQRMQQQEQIRRQQQQEQMRRQEEMRRQQQIQAERQRQMQDQQRRQQEAMQQRQRQNQNQVIRPSVPVSTARGNPAPRSPMPNTATGVNRAAYTSKPNGPVSFSNGMAKLSRPLTPAEVKRGFTGKVTADGRALVRFQGRVFAVPARGVSGLIKPAANQSPSASRLTTLQRQQRDTRIAAIVAGQPLIAAAGGGSRGGGGPLSRSVPANNNIKPLRVYRQPVGRWDREAAIKRTLSDFGVPNDKLGSYLKGVDLSKPVIMRRYPKGTIFTQYSFPNQPGAWFTTPGTPMNKLGISEFGEDGLKRQEFRYIAKNDVYMLESTAADFTDESGSVLPGGGYQLFTNDKNAFEIHDPSTN